MPILPPLIPPTPYDSVELILWFARVIANDAGLSMAGDLLSDNQPYTMTMLNLAWRKLQDRLNNNNIEEFPQEIILTNVPAQAAIPFSDPAIFCSIDYYGYWDGATTNNTITLPSDLEVPYKLWVRPTGMNAQFVPTRMVPEGLPAVPKTSTIGLWEWRDDKIWFPGANAALDFRIRYRRILNDVSSLSIGYIPLTRCAVALAYLTVEIFATSRGSVVLPNISAQGEDAIKQLINQSTRKNQRINNRRIPYSRRGRMW